MEGGQPVNGLDAALPWLAPSLRLRWRRWLVRACLSGLPSVTIRLPFSSCYVMLMTRLPRVMRLFYSSLYAD
jgi:hypothetical protein